MIEVCGITLSIGEFPLLDNVQFKIEPSERLALIGRNGAGKTTLLKIMASQEDPDSGQIKKGPHDEIVLLSQALPLKEDKTVYDVVAEGVSDIGDLLKQYHDTLAHQPEPGKEPQWQDRVNKLQSEIEQKDGWILHQRIEKVITELDLPADKKMSTLSGGWRKRVALAKALVRQPTLLMLDEPTNHLDIEAIQWLEGYIKQYPKAILFITHDRVLLQKIATGILELDRGVVTRYPSDYQLYLKRKQKQLEEEIVHNEKFDKKLSQEEAWVRQGIKARRTRNEGRVRALEKLRKIRSQRREQLKNPFMQAGQAESSGKRIFSIENLSFSFDEKTQIIHDFSFEIQQGDKVVVFGPNGAGKSTLIQLLLGDLAPTTGTIKQGAKNQIVYFDQHREQIDPEKSLIDNVAEGDLFIEIEGKRKHIISYLGDFLFSPEQARGPARALSGGECNRLLLAKIFSKPANVLVLDEPTNDLDIESLEILETLLLTYNGTVIVISHDRQFMDNIATHYVAFAEKGEVISGVGGYTEFLEYTQSQKQKEVKKKSPTKEQSQISQKPASKKAKLSYKEQRELDALPKKIETIEAEIAKLHDKMAEPDYFKQSADLLKETSSSLEKLEAELNQLYARWETLDEN